MKKRVLIIIASVLAALAVVTGVYLGSYYRAENVGAYLESGDAVDVREIKEGYFFDGKGEDKALIFYPGANVEETAYAPLMKALAEQGVDCFLLRMPLRHAFAGMNKADRIIKEYKYTEYYLAGHSLGGAIAANYCAKHTDEFSGLFLLAAYPSEDISKAQFPVVFIYGENDGVLNRQRLEKGFTLVPEDYKVIEIKGGNHSGVASYGEQRGDGKAEITAGEQQKETVKAIIESIERKD